jgi:hypothetical protein
LLITGARVLVEGYKGYRVWYFLVNSYFTGESMLRTYRSSTLLIVVTGIMDEVVLILIVISTIMCIRNFGKGLREMMIKQVKANEVIPPSDDSATVSDV